ncbi:deoxyribonuclease V [Candidatus Poribacteria bacterium]|nr:deoxyribonuclease V [Candidatus Poribacteria bacterium]
MQFQQLHPWDLTPKEARQLQNELRTRVLKIDQFQDIKTVAGVDIGLKKDKALAAVMVLNLTDLQIIDGVVAESRITFPYVPGLLSFREIPPLLVAFSHLQTKPDLVIVDGQGLAHPRRFGLASHLGLILNIPTIGCAKSRLCGEYTQPEKQKGSYTHITDKNEIIGVALRTRTDVSVVYVSIGHKISLSSARKLTLACCDKYRLPETTRYAHKAATGKMLEGLHYVNAA